MDADTLERRAAEVCGFDPLDVLQARRARKVAEAAPLRALRDVWDAKRKAQRGLETARIAAEYEAAGKRLPAADTLEMLASGSASYRDFITQAETAFIRLAILEDEIAGINDTILRQRDLLRMHAAEAHLEPAGV